MSSQDENTVVNLLPQVTISISEGFSLTTTRSCIIIRCMQWDEAAQGWGIEEHFVEQTAEMSSLEM
jgi:hypothetical protein